MERQIQKMKRPILISITINFVLSNPFWGMLDGWKRKDDTERHERSRKNLFDPVIWRKWLGWKSKEVSKIIKSLKAQGKSNDSKTMLLCSCLGGDFLENIKSWNVFLWIFSKHVQLVLILFKQFCYFLVFYSIL